MTRCIMLWIRTRFILHTGQTPEGSEEDILQAISCLQPQLQCILPAMVLTSGLFHSDALCARATAANNATKKLLFHFCMFPCDSDHFHPGPYHPRLGWCQADERA